MNRFDYVRPATVAEAVAAAAEPGAAYLAAGTNLLDLMKAGAARPSRLVDVTRLPGLDRIDMLPDGGVRIGALVRNADLARHRAFARAYPVGCRGLAVGRLGAAAQRGDGRREPPAAHALRLLLRPRQRLQPARAGRGLRRARAARTAATRSSGGAMACIATHPSDFCVPLVALDAVVEITGPAGSRELPLEDLHRLPGDRPERESELAPGELIVALRLPAEAAAFRAHARYLKLRERTSFAFALVSAAAALEIADGTIGRARLALGGVAARPWRARGAEALLEGVAPTAPPSPARPRRRSPRRGRPGTTPTRSSSRSASPRVPCCSPPPGRPSACPRFPHPSSPIPEPSPMPDTLPLPAGHVRLGSNSGQPMTRRDGVLKVTGAATYAADNHPAGLLHAVYAVSTIARGRVEHARRRRRQGPPGGRRGDHAGQPPAAGPGPGREAHDVQLPHRGAAGRPRALRQPADRARRRRDARGRDRGRAAARADLRRRAGPDRLRRRRAVSARRPSESAVPPTSPRATSPPASRPRRAGPRRRSRRRSSTTTPWSRTRSSPRGTATG